MARLGDIFVITSGGTPNRKNNEYYDNGTIPWVKTGDLKEKYVSQEVECITELGVKNSSAKRFPEGTVLVAMYGATIGACSILPYEATTNQACAAFLPNEHVIPDFLYYFLCGKKEKFIKDGVGGAQPNISASYLKNVEIFVPSLEEQQRTILILDAVDTLLSLRKQQLAKLDELVKSRFVEMFGDPESNPCGWPVKKLEVVVASITAGWSANGEARPKKAGEKAVLKVSAVTQGFFKPDEHKVIPADMEIKKYVYPQKGDLLFSRANTRELVGATAIIEQDYPELLLPDKLWKVLFTNEMDVYYAKHILSTQAIRKVFSAQSTGTSGSMYNVSADKFRETRIPVPPIMLQREFASFVQHTDKSKLAVQQSIGQMETLKKSLMQKYFG